MVSMKPQTKLAFMGLYACCLIGTYSPHFIPQLSKGKYSELWTAPVKMLKSLESIQNDGTPSRVTY